jgi:hypothetical protein
LQHGLASAQKGNILEDDHGVWVLRRKGSWSVSSCIS